MKTIVLLTIVFFTFGVATAVADQITLKNGDRLTGKIVKSDGGKLVIKTDLLGDVTVDLVSNEVGVEVKKPLWKRCSKELPKRSHL